MKKIVLILGLLISSILSNAQIVDNIRTQQDGEKINILYQINNSNSNQLYKVEVLCQINDGNKVVLRSISGDVGDGIRGGKNDYKAVWDVLKDVDELTNAEFFVKIDLKKEEVKVVKPERSSSGFNPFKYQKENNGQVFIATQTFGGKIGYAHKFFMIGISSGIDLLDKENFMMATFGASILKNQNTQIFTCVLVGMHETFDERTFEWGPAFAYGMGFQFFFGHIGFNFDYYRDKSSFSHMVLGIGWRF